MEFYLLAALCGLIYGALTGYIKYRLLWRPIMKGSRAATGGKVYSGIGLSLIADLVILFIVFFVRNLLPFSFEVTLIGAAVSLSLIGILLPQQEIKKMRRNGELDVDPARLVKEPYADKDEELRLKKEHKERKWDNSFVEDDEEGNA